MKQANNNTIWYYLALFTLLFALNTQPIYADYTTSLATGGVAFFNFSDTNTSTVKDSWRSYDCTMVYTAGSVGHNNLANTGYPSFGVSGSGTNASFKSYGNDRCTLSNPLIASWESKPLAWSIWFNSTYSGANDNYITRCSVTSPFGMNTYLRLTNTGEVVFANNDGDWDLITTTGGNYNDGTWHHTIGIFDYDNNLIYLYVDGSLIGSTASTAYVGNNVACGIGFQDTNNGFNGEIDHVMFYNKTLTTDEISQLYSYGASNYLTDVSITECDDTLTPALNFTFYSEENNNTINNADFEVLLYAWTVQEPDTKAYFSFSNMTLPRPWYELCVPDTTVQYRANIDGIVTKTDLNDATITKINYVVNGTLQTIAVYMTNDTTTTAITLTVVDENDLALSGYLVEADRYDIGTNSYITVDSQYTTPDGIIVFNLDVSTNQYRFKVYDPDGNLVYTEEKQKLTQTAYTLRVVLGEFPIDVHTKIYYLDINFTADKPTKTFETKFSNLAANAYGIMMVTRRVNFTDEATIDTQYSSSNTGSLTYTITDDTTDISVSYISTVYINSSDDGNLYVYDTKTIDYRKEWDVFGEEAMFVSFIFIGTMVFIGLAVSATLGLLLMIFGFIVMYLLGFINVGIVPVMSLIAGIAVLMVRLKR